MKLDMIFSITMLILIVFFFFLALQCHIEAEYEYYENGGVAPTNANWGSFQYVPLTDIVNNFLLNDVPWNAKPSPVIKAKNGMFLILAEIPPQITNLIPCARIKSGCFFLKKFERFLRVLISPIKLKPCLLRNMASYSIPSLFI